MQNSRAVVYKHASFLKNTQVELQNTCVLPTRVFKVRIELYHTSTSPVTFLVETREQIYRYSNRAVGHNWSLVTLIY